MTARIQYKGHVAVSLNQDAYKADSSGFLALEGEPEYLQLLLRSLSAYGAVQQSEPELYTLSRSHSLFADPVFEAAFGGW